MFDQAWPSWPSHRWTSPSYCPPERLIDPTAHALVRDTGATAKKRVVLGSRANYAGCSTPEIAIRWYVVQVCAEEHRLLAGECDLREPRRARLFERGASLAEARRWGPLGAAIVVGR